ncbi:DUF3885 domain-containing protein [Sphingobacterium sp.]|uniref:DUF3885 domain-containing protein n=1 Tax=Sphingobacterium sp. TaxID=341027 RepID=UPI002590C51F|nr:DUF3885 domain-containing protein [Sphingobacterium sp.]WET67790.1 MAG: DUF3885 domain-containing protein [Sphingobacterium sp.]
MQTTKQEYRQFLQDHFKRLNLRAPLFYNSDFGLRFDLQVGETNTEKYFQNVIRRATAIFQNAFDDSDNVFLVLMDYKYKRRKIRFSNFIFKQIQNFHTGEINFLKEIGLYDPHDKFDIRNIGVIKLTSGRINHKTVLLAIANQDFPSRFPRLENNHIISSKEIYFININKKLILNMYDDRGLDVVATDIETLRPIYEKHKDWILDYDREQIEKLFV